MPTADQLPLDRWHKDWRAQHRTLLVELQGCVHFYHVPIQMAFNSTLNEGPRVVDYVVGVAESLVTNASDVPKYEMVWNEAAQRIAQLNAELVVSYSTWRSSANLTFFCRRLQTMIASRGSHLTEWAHGFKS
jgi:hypothetical protein